MLFLLLCSKEMEDLIQIIASLFLNDLRCSTPMGPGTGGRFWRGWVCRHCIDSSCRMCACMASSPADEACPDTRDSCHTSLQLTLFPLSVFRWSLCYFSDWHSVDQGRSVRQSRLQLFSSFPSNKTNNASHTPMCTMDVPYCMGLLAGFYLWRRKNSSTKSRRTIKQDRICKGCFIQSFH